MSEAAEPTAKKQKVEADEAEAKEEVKEEAKEDEKKADEEPAKDEADAPEEPAAAAEDADGVKTGELQRGDDGVAYIMLSAKKRVLLKAYRGEPQITIQDVRFAVLFGCDGMDVVKLIFSIFHF